MKPILNLLILFLFISFISCEKKDSESNSFYSYLNESDFIRDGLIGYFPFNGDIKNYYGTANNATALNPKFGIDRFNSPKGSINFNGIDDYLLISNIGNSFTRNEGTIAFWCKIDNVYNNSSQPKPVVISIVDSVNFSLLLSSSYSNLLWLSYGNYPLLGGQSIESSFEKERYKLNVLTFTDSSIITYSFSNDLLLKTTISNSMFSFGFNNIRKNQDIYLGKSIIDTFDSDVFDNYFTYFKGEIDDLLIYDRILTEEEITLFFNMVKD